MNSKELDKLTKRASKAVFAAWDPDDMLFVLECVQLNIYMTLAGLDAEKAEAVLIASAQNVARTLRAFGEDRGEYVQ